MIDKKIIGALMLFLAITAAVESRPRLLVLTLTTPPDSPSPLNPGPYGSSILASRLSAEESSEVVVLPDVSDLKRARLEADTIVFVVIGSDYLDRGVFEETVRVVEEATYGRLNNVRARSIMLLYADESPDEALLDPLLRLERRLCGRAEAIISPYTLGSDRAAVSIVGGEELLLTGYTSFIARSSDPMTPLIMWPIPPGDQAREQGVLAIAWPSSPPLNPANLWYPVAYYCKGPLGGVILLADTTILINLAQNLTAEYTRLFTGIVREAVGGDGEVVYVFNLAHYSGRGFRESVAVRFHPSILVINALNAYVGIESSMINFMTRIIPVFALGLISGVALLLLALMRGYIDELLPSREEK